MPDQGEQQADIAARVQTCLSGLRTDPDLCAARQSEWITLTLDLQLITPMLGGGVKAGEIDFARPIRPEAVAGAIRHWWWLLQRHRFEPDFADELYQEMTDIWGDASKGDENRRAKVRVSMKCPPLQDADIRYFAPYRLKMDQDRNPTLVENYDLMDEKYALFSANGKPIRFNVVQVDLAKEIRDQCATERPNWWPRRLVVALVNSKVFSREEMPKPLIQPGYKFTAAISINNSLSPARFKQVLDALKAWVAVSGIGARTSMGCGRVQVVSCNLPTFPEEKGELLEKAELINATKQQIDGRFSKEIAGKDFLLHIGRSTGANALLSWTLAIKCYREFRQNRNGLSRSFHADPDTLRFITGFDMNGKHAVRHPLVGEGEGRYLLFPRMFLGAPMIVEFTKRNKEDVGRDPPKTETVFSGFKRYSSPVIKTVVKLNDGYHPALLFLPYQLDIQGKKLEVKHSPGKPKDKPIKIIDWGKWFPDDSEYAQQVFRYRANGQTLDEFYAEAEDIDTIDVLKSFAWQTLY